MLVETRIFCLPAPPTSADAASQVYAIHWPPVGDAGGPESGPLSGVSGLKLGEVL